MAAVIRRGDAVKKTHELEKNRKIAFLLVKVADLAPPKRPLNAPPRRKFFEIGVSRHQNAEMTPFQAALNLEVVLCLRGSKVQAA